MNNLANDIMEILQTHASVKTTRVVYYDETPLGKPEVKVRCGLPKIISCRFGFILNPNLWIMHINYFPQSRCYVGITPHIMGFPMHHIISMMNMVTSTNLN